MAALWSLRHGASEELETGTLSRDHTQACLVSQHSSKNFLFVYLYVFESSRKMLNLYEWTRPKHESCISSYTWSSFASYNWFTYCLHGTKVNAHKVKDTADHVNLTMTSPLLACHCKSHSSLACCVDPINKCHIKTSLYCCSECPSTSWNRVVTERDT